MLRKNLDFGTEAEKQLIKLLLENGAEMIIPMNSRVDNVETTSAPMILLKTRMMLSPDLLVLQEGEWIWIECKAKNAPSYYRRLERLEHVLDYESLVKYQRVQEISGFPVEFFFFESSTGEWLSVSLNDALMYGEHRLNYPARGGGFVIPRYRMTLYYSPN